MLTSGFKSDFDFFINKLNNKENFTLSRWGDGELMILEGKDIDLTKKGNGEFRYINGDDECEIARSILKKSYTYSDDAYYIGIACRCCVGDDKFEYMKNESTQKDDKLTWANIFVNSNFKYVQTDLIPALKNRKVNIVCNINSNLDRFPFNLKNIWKVGTDAWTSDFEIIDAISDYITDNDIKDEVFLFAAGPLANMLTYKLHLVSNKNTYIDIGSILDKELGLMLTRGYQKGAPTLNKTCIW